MSDRLNRKTKIETCHNHIVTEHMSNMSDRVYSAHSAIQIAM